jgi:hypothetical protein
MTQAQSSRYGTKHQRELEDPEIMTTEQFCSLAQIHPITAVIWRRQGRGPAFIDATDARFIRYLRTDVLAWLEQNRRNTSPDNGSFLPARKHNSEKSKRGHS